MVGPPIARDALTVLGTLSSWQVYEAKAGVLTSLDTGVSPRPDVNSLWCRRDGEKSWSFELMLDGALEDRWVFRREPEIQLPLTDLIRWSTDGLPYLAPEVQLLYKSKGLRDRDQADFEMVVRRLDAGARRWLRESLVKVEPAHRWLTLLDGDY